MARQDVVRALVPQGRLDEVLTELLDTLEVGPERIQVEPVEPGTYRDERPDLELRSLIRVGRRRTLLGAVVGAVVGALIAVAIPALREWAPMSVALLAFGLAWGTAAAVAARTVQLRRDGGDRPETLHQIGHDDAEQLRLVTVRVVHERPEVVDQFTDQGMILLDSLHPRADGEASGARSADPDADGAGPPAP